MGSPVKYPALYQAVLYCIQHDVEMPADLEEALGCVAPRIKSLVSRTKLEKKLAKVLGAALRGQLENLLDILGNPPDLSKLNEAFWIEAGRELTGAIMPVLQDAFIQQAADFVAEEGIGVDWALINKGAADWARSYAYSMVSGINQTTRDALQSSISDYFTQGWTMGDLESKLGEFYGPVRAEMIAVTEVTRASVQGELATAEEIRQMNPNIELIPIWNTNNDDLVCEICGPYNGTTIDVWGNDYPDGPPGHTRCRCWLTHDVKVNE